MPPPQLQRGLQPSLLDRLLDPEAAGTAILSGYTVEKMVLAVRRDLEDLLNAVHPFHSFPANFPETRDSVVTYGLPDLASTQAISADQRAAIGRAIAQAVRQNEPRLKTVKVTILTQDEDLTKMSVRFRVEARLTVDPAPDVAFDTILEMGTGKYEVRRAGS